MLAHSPRVLRFALGVLALLVAVGAPPGTAVAQIPISTYQVDLGAPATSVAQALATRPQRMAAALEAQACGNEVRFLADAQAPATGEDGLSALVRKAGGPRLGTSLS